MIYSGVSFTYWINKSIICFPSIRVEDRFIKVYFSLDDWTKCLCFTIWNNLWIDFHSSILIISFYESGYWLFLCSSSLFKFSGGSSLSLSSEITFIHLYLSSYFLFEFLYSIKIDDLSEYAEISVNSFSIIPRGFTRFL